MSSENTVKLYGYIKEAANHGNYGTAVIVTDKYDHQSKSFSDVEIPVMIQHGQNPPKYDKLEDGKPVRFSGEVAVKKDGSLGLKGFIKLFYLGKFEAKPAEQLAGAGAANTAADDEPPF